MKFLHTSDWHLGRQLHNASLLEDQAYVLDQIVDIASQQAVDAVLIAGDVYDRTVPPARAVSLLDSVLDRLCREKAIPVIVIPGNHDSAERLGFGARQLSASGLFIIDSPEAILSPVILEDGYGKTAFYGIPYLEPAVAREYFDVELSGHDETLAYVAKRIKSHNQKKGSYRTVVLSHCFLNGGEACESERPLSVGGADQASAKNFKAFDYTALGHLHGTQYRYHEKIRYSGSILKYSFSEERHTKSVTLVDMDAQGECAIEEIALKPLHDMRTLEGSLAEILAMGKTDHNALDYVQVRLSDTHAILDIMGKLREVYPNVLHLERPGLLSASSGQMASRERLKKGEMSMFRDFYEQVRGESMSSAQDRLLEETIENLHRAE
ncbi:MAG: exonuclease SbcCD subunit D [Proteobacteria bacterium]|nr:exonuclease SbcCD subunit D [Pseudomonadota bacterium]